MPRERRAARCSHCREQGHNIASCTIYKIKINSALACGNNNLNIQSLKIYPIISATNLDSIVKFNLLYRGLLPYVTCFNYQIFYNRSEQKYVYIKKTNEYIEEINKITKGPKETSDISIKTKRNYKIRLKYYRENSLWSSYIIFDDLIDIFNNDYIEVTTRLNNERVAREAQYQQYVQQRERERAEALQREAQANIIINRRELPILRTDEVAADDCPICMEILGETNKSVLRCGHSLCTSCLLTQTLRGVALKSTSSCFCTVCRAPYL